MSFAEEGLAWLEPRDEDGFVGDAWLVSPNASTEQKISREEYS